MQKTWNLTYFEDGKPVGQRRGISHEDAVAELYRLAHGGAPVTLAPVASEPEQVAAPVAARELSLAA